MSVQVHVCMYVILKQIIYYKISICVYFMCMSTCLHVYKHTMCIPDAHGNQKQVLDPLKLELQTTMNYQVGSGDWTGVHCKDIKHSKPLSLI